MDGFAPYGRLGAQLEEVFDEPFRFGDTRLGQLVLAARGSKSRKGYVSVRDICTCYPHYSVGQVRTAAFTSKILQLSSNLEAVRRVYGSKLDVVEYINYIFGDDQFPGSHTDTAYRKHGGWVPVTDLAKFNRMSRHNVPASLIHQACAESSVVVVSSNGKYIRRAAAAAPRRLNAAAADWRLPGAGGSNTFNPNAGEFRSTAGPLPRPAVDPAVLAGPGGDEAASASAALPREGHAVPGLRAGAGAGGGAGAGAGAGGAGVREMPARHRHVVPLKTISTIQDRFGLQWGARKLVTKVAAPPAFTVVSWNVLADKEARKDRKTLTMTGPWPRRMKMLVARLLTFDADIMCLQEVQQAPGSPPKYDHALALEQAFAPHGYTTVRSETRGRRTVALLLYKSSTFKAAGPPVTTYKQFEHLALSMPSGMQHSYRVCLQRASGRLAIAPLTHIATGRMVLAVSNHPNVPMEMGSMAHYKPLMDSVVACGALEVMQAEYSARHPHVVLAADMNSRTADAAATFYTTGALSDEDRYRINTQCARDDLPPLPTQLATRLRLSDAYVGILGKPPAYTNCNHHNDFVGDIDHILHSAGLTPLAALDVYPWSSALHPHTPVLPNAAIPSDHLPLFATFAFAE